MAHLVQTRPLAAAGLLGTLLAGAAAGRGPDHLAAALLGLAAGVALYHARFGFTSAWRAFLREGRGEGLRAQFLLLGLASLVAYPLIGAGLAWPVVLPLGPAFVLGAILFGIGMQLGGGCGSGTLYTAGGGSVRMLATLAAFIAGSVAATFHDPFWSGLPVTPGGFGLVGAVGPLPALLLLGAVLVALARWTRAVERRRGLAPRAEPPADWLGGPWPLVAGAVALAAVAAGHWVFLGRPWGVTWGFAVWGAQALQALGVDMAALPYWQVPWRAADLSGGPLSSPTNASNLGIMAGALAAAALGGRFAPSLRLSARDLLIAVAGGLLMGYGARLSGGCNIGAFLGGITSGSLHGLAWALLAFLGAGVGVRLRIRLGVDPPLAPNGA